MTAPLTRRTPSARAFTLVELLVVLFMSAVFGLIIAQTVNSATATAQRVLSDTQAREDAHVAMTSLTRALRGAHALGACTDTGRPVDRTLALCQRIGEHDTTSAFDRVTPTEIRFFSHSAGAATRCTDTTDPDAQADALAPSELVQVSVDEDNRLWIRRWCAPPGATYTDQQGRFEAARLHLQPGAANLTLDGGTVLAPDEGQQWDLFTFLGAQSPADADCDDDPTTTSSAPAAFGQLCALDSTGALAHPGDIAMVEVAPRFAAGHGRNAASFTADIVVPLSLADPNEGAGQ